jgi:ABC-2 type transport system ATP-binding protein
MIDLRNVNFKYPRQALLFEEISLQLRAGQIFGLLGQNGEGKTSLLHLMAGLLFPQQGTCRVAGYVPRFRQPAFLESVYFLPEEIHLPATTVARFVRTYAAFYPLFSQEQFGSYLREFGIDASLPAQSLSQGQRKKALIAFGLATNAPVLLLDEPTNGLDIPSKSQFRKLIASVLSPERTVVISTHQVRDVESLVDAVVILHEHRIVLDATLEDIAETLCFKHIPSGRVVSDAFFVRPSLDGQFVVVPNVNHESTRPDLEALFQAVISHPAAIQQLFSNRQATYDEQPSL